MFKLYMLLIYKPQPSNTILSFMTDGILIIYYGQEQGFSEPRIL